MKKLLIVFLSLFFFSFSKNKSLQNNFSKEIEDRIKQVEQNIKVISPKGDTATFTLEERMKHYRINGISVAVINNYQIEWAKGYGFADVAEKTPVTPETPFEACSITKSFTALAILKLVQDKNLDLYTDINNYLKTWKFPYDKKSGNKKIGIANLLSHTAGISGGESYTSYTPDEKAPTIEQLLNNVHSIYEAGLKYEYTNNGFTIVRKIIDDITGMPYEKLMLENILQPLDMKNSFYVFDVNKKPATGYKSNGKEIKGKHEIIPDMASGGLWSTPTDIAKLVIEMELSYEGKSNKILSRKTIDTMLTPYIDKNSALGVFIYKKNNTTYFEHAGHGEGFGSWYKGMLAGGKGMVIMCNSNDRRIITELFFSIARTYQWDGFVNKIPKLEKE